MVPLNGTIRHLGRTAISGSTKGTDFDWQETSDREARVQKSNISRIEMTHSPSNAAKLDVV
jgi:hypothetical protein